MGNTTGPASGQLLIHGGRTIDGQFWDLFEHLAVNNGGGAAELVYIPSAKKKSEITVNNGDTVFINGLLKATVLHTRQCRKANQLSFVKSIQNAQGVFIDGGRQPRLAKTYLNTRTHDELQNLLDRGGVIAGSSAGEMIMSSFLVRGEGSPTYKNTIVIGSFKEGFGFIKNIAFDVHVDEYKRDTDLTQVLNLHPELLGIGIDIGTAIHVQGNEFIVMGPGRVLVHDGSKQVQTLKSGARFDMQKRALI